MAVAISVAVFEKGIGQILARLFEGVLFLRR